MNRVPLPIGLAVGDGVAWIALSSADAVLKILSVSPLRGWCGRAHWIAGDKVVARSVYLVVHLNKLIDAELILRRKIIARRFPCGRVQRARQRYFWRAFTQMKLTRQSAAPALKAERRHAHAGSVACTVKRR